MDNYYTLDDLKDLSKDSGNDNPSIFILSDMKTSDETDEAFAPTNIFIDDDGDIIIQVDKHLIEN